MKRNAWRIGLAAFAAIVAPGAVALAAGWSFRAEADGPTAGFATDDGFSGLWITCAPAGARLRVSVPAPVLAGGRTQTAVVNVDEVVFLQRMSPRPGNAAILERSLPAAEFAGLAAALAKGRRAEIATPSGRFVLPLGGSGKALTRLRAACG